MIFGRVGADHHDDFRVLALVEGGRYRPRADPLHQRRNRGGVAEPRAMVDIVGAEAGAHQLLEEIGLLVRAFGRAEAGEPLGSVAVADFLQSGSGAVERFVPGRFAEMRPRVRRVDPLVRNLRHAIPADHRLQQTFRVVHVVEAETALHAEPILIGRTVAAGHVQQLVVLDMIGELAADAAIGAHAVHGAIRKAGAHIGGIHQTGRHQGAGRTGLHAFAASHAGRRPHRIVEVEHDLLGMAAPRHADHVVDLHLAAGADAQIALNAGIEIDRHGGMAAVGYRRSPARKAALLQLLPRDDLPELGVGIVGDIARRLIGEQQLGHHAARRRGAIGLRLHLHAGRRHADAARREHTLAFDLDHADAAIAVRAISRHGRSSRGCGSLMPQRRAALERWSHRRVPQPPDRRA